MMQSFLWNNIFKVAVAYQKTLFPLYAAMSIAVVFIGCIAIDQFRIYLFHRFRTKVEDRIRGTFERYKFINSDMENWLFRTQGTIIPLHTVRNTDTVDVHPSPIPQLFRDWFCPTITYDKGEFDLLFKKYISILLVILSILLIIAFTLQPGSASSALAMHFVNVIAKVNNKLNHTTADWYAFYILVRKLAHSVEYLLMGVTSSFFFLVWAKKRPFLLAVVFCAVVSMCDQLSKIVVPGREFDITDIPFDMMGYLIGILFVYVARHEWHKFKQRWWWSQT